MDHGVGGGQVQADAAGFQADQEQRRLAALEARHHVAALRRGRVAGQRQPGQAQRGQFGFHQPQHAGELREHQHPPAFGHQRGQALAQPVELGAVAVGSRSHRALGAQQPRVVAGLAQLQQRVQDADHRAVEMLLGQHPPHLLVGGQADTFVQHALRAGQCHAVHLLGQRRQLSGHLVLAAAQDEGRHPLCQQPGALGFAVFLDRGAPVALEAAGVAQPARQQEMKLRPQLAQVVFQRRAGQAEPVAGVQPARRGGRAAAGVLDHLRFVQHHQVPGLALQRHRVAPQQRVAGQHQLVLRDAGQVLAALRPAQCQQLQRRRHAGGFGLPVEQQRGRRHHQRGAVEPAGLLLDQQVGQRLRGFAQTHVVGQDARQVVAAQLLQPGQAVALVGPQRDAQPGGGLDRRRRAVHAHGRQPGQPGSALQGPVAPCAGVRRHGVAQAGAQQGQALGVPAAQQQAFVGLAARPGQQVDHRANDGLQRRGQRVDAAPARRMQPHQLVVGDGPQRVGVGPASVAGDQPGQQRHQVQCFGAVAGVQVDLQAQQPRAHAARLAQRLQGDLPAGHRFDAVGEAGRQFNRPARGPQRGQGGLAEVAEVGLAHEAVQRLVGQR